MLAPDEKPERTLRGALYRAAVALTALALAGGVSTGLVPAAWLVIVHPDAPSVSRPFPRPRRREALRRERTSRAGRLPDGPPPRGYPSGTRSEERRVGKEG